jgi:cytochrome c6
MNRSRSRMGWRMLPLSLCLLVFSAPLWAQGEGAALFKSKCAACHGADGTGNTPVAKAMHIPDLTSAAVQKQTDAELTAAITNGKGSMPAYKDKLSADQIKGAVGYIRELAKKK